MGYWDDDGMAAHSSSAGNSTWVKRFMQRRRYTRLHGGGRSNRMRIAKLGRRKGTGVFLVWKVKAVPKLRLRVVRTAAKSWGRRMRDAYVDMMMGFTRSCTIRSKPARRMAVQDFNTKVVIEMYKSLGIQVQAGLDSHPKTNRLIM
jgi:hypothetical protein